MSSGTGASPFPASTGSMPFAILSMRASVAVLLSAIAFPALSEALCAVSNEPGARAIAVRKSPTTTASILFFIMFSLQRTQALGRKQATHTAVPEPYPINDRAFQFVPEPHEIGRSRKVSVPRPNSPEIGPSAKPKGLPDFQEASGSSCTNLVVGN